MLQPSPDVDTLFEDLWQDLPPETTQMAREFKAFTRVRKMKTPVQLLRVVLRYCGLDKSLREVAGHVTLLVERITDTAVAERLSRLSVLGAGLARPHAAAPQSGRAVGAAPVSGHRRQRHPSPGCAQPAVSGAPVHGDGDVDLDVHRDHRSTDGRELEALPAGTG